MPWWLPQTRARVHPEVDPAADRIPFRRDRDRLADDVQVAPALGEPALALERGAAAVQDRIGSPDSVLHLRVFAQQAGGPAPRLLAPGQLDQRVDAGPRDAGDHGAVVRPHPALDR